MLLADQISNIFVLTKVTWGRAKDILKENGYNEYQIEEISKIGKAVILQFLSNQKIRCSRDFNACDENPLFFELPPIIANNDAFLKQISQNMTAEIKDLAEKFALEIYYKAQTKPAEKQSVGQIIFFDASVEECVTIH